MLERGVIVSHETMTPLVREVRAGLRERPAPTAAPARRTWHPDEVFIKIGGEQKYLWRAVDAGGDVLDILIQNRRDKAAARCFFLNKSSHLVSRR
ncbi:hypothetical protein GCM10010421_23060 [Streptomyces glaucus]|uniref:DDE domain-containing protein n=1 Tax=Streptomyces glaucus TaxID=284029 RepID=A0ABP5WQP0_9ACTN